jgi:hypothetical protein
MTNTRIATIFVGGPLSSVYEDEVAEEPVMKPDKLPQLRSPKKADRKPAPEKRSVHMSPDVHFREIPHLSDLSEEEINAVWLTPEEFMETKKAYSKIVQMMMRSREPIEETDEICTRGLGTFILLLLHVQNKLRFAGYVYVTLSWWKLLLSSITEFRTKEGSRRRKRIKKQAVDAVLLEQEIQGEEGLIDKQWISDVYREVTGPSSLNALNMGLKDEKQMLAVLDPEDREKRECLKSKRKSLELPKARRSSIESLDDEALLRRLVQKTS